MKDESRLIPAGSQTVGPFFSIGVDYLIDRRGNSWKNRNPRASAGPGQQSGA
jgi:hypothetical protein